MYISFSHINAYKRTKGPTFQSQPAPSKKSLKVVASPTIPANNTYLHFYSSAISKKIIIKNKQPKRYTQCFIFYPSINNTYANF